MAAREDAFVQKIAQTFVEQVYDREDIWHIYDEVEHILDIIKETHLGRILNSATVSLEDKEEFLRTLRQSEYRFVNDLVEVVIQNGQAGLLKEILETVLFKISKHKNAFDAVVTSVQPLTDEQKERIATLTEKRFDIRVRNVVEHIDREILGGFIVNINHHVIDASVRSQLKDIRKKL